MYIAASNIQLFFLFLLKEKTKISLKKFVKIGRPGYKGKTLFLFCFTFFALNR